MVLLPGGSHPEGLCVPIWECGIDLTWIGDFCKRYEPIEMNQSATGIVRCVSNEKQSVLR